MGRVALVNRFAIAAQQGVRTMTPKRPSLGHALAILFLCLTALVSTGSGRAQAQTIDYVLNMNDTGFDPIAAGGTIKYTATVVELEGDPAPATTITITIPATTSLTATAGNITGCGALPVVGPATRVCNVPALPANGTATLELSVLTTQQTVISVGASVPVAGDADPVNNSVVEATTVDTGANLGLTVSGPATASSGSTVTYQFTATNAGPDVASGAVLQFPIPTGLVNLVPPANCNLSGQTYSCTISGPIGVGATVVRSFSGQIAVADSSDITPLATVSVNSPSDPVTSNNSATMTTDVTPGSDVKIAIARSPNTSHLVGDAVSFTATPTYTGGVPNGLTFNTTIPANYTVNTITAPGWTCTPPPGPAIQCTRAGGTVAGANVSLGNIVIGTTVVSAGAPTMTGTISSAGPVDPDLTNNTATDGGTTVAPPVVDLRANMTGPNPAIGVVGNTYTQNISITNIGNAGFFGTATMDFTIPTGQEVVGYNLNGWTCTPAASPASPVPAGSVVNCTRPYTTASKLNPNATTRLSAFRRA